MAQPMTIFKAPGADASADQAAAPRPGQIGSFPFSASRKKFTDR